MVSVRTNSARFSIRVSLRSDASPRGVAMRTPGWSASATLRIEEPAGTKKVRSYSYAGGEKSASAARAGSIARNATSHAPVRTPSITAPGLGYSTGTNSTPIRLASARPRSSAGPSFFTSAGARLISAWKSDWLMYCLAKASPVKVASPSMSESTAVPRSLSMLSGWSLSRL